MEPGTVQGISTQSEAPRRVQLSRAVVRQCLHPALWRSVGSSSLPSCPHRHSTPEGSDTAFLCNIPVPPDLAASRAQLPAPTQAMVLWLAAFRFKHSSRGGKSKGRARRRSAAEVSPRAGTTCQSAPQEELLQGPAHPFQPHRSGAVHIARLLLSFPCVVNTNRGIPSVSATRMRDSQWQPAQQSAGAACPIWPDMTSV